MLATLEGNLLSVLAFGTFHPQYNFLGGLSLLPENRLSLSTESLLFTIVTSTTLRGVPFFALLVLCDFVSLVDFALFAKGASLLRHVHHLDCLEGKNRVVTLVSIFQHVHINIPSL